MTVFCPLTTTGAGELVVQNADGPRFVVDSRVKPVKLVGQVRTTFGQAGVIASWGGVTGSEMLNIVPLPPLPPTRAVP